MMPFTYSKASSLLGENKTVYFNHSGFIDNHLISMFDDSILVFGKRMNIEFNRITKQITVQYFDEDTEHPGYMKTVKTFSGSCALTERG
jgi:hypothetical protein